MRIKSTLYSLFQRFSKPTFRAVANDYLDIALANCCAHVQKYTRSRFDLWVYPRIGSLRIDRVKPQQIIDCVLDFQAAAPSQSRRLLQVISGVYRYAKAKGLCDSNPADGLGIVLTPYQYKGFNHIAPKQMPAFLGAVDNRVTLDKAAVTAFWLIVYTAVRRGEAVNAAVDELDFSAAEWTIPAARMKNRKPHTVPLSPQVCAMLQDWLAERRACGIDSPLLFGGIGGHRPLQVITQAKWRDRMTLHGLRKVFSTHAHESGLWSVDAIELQLSHTIPGVRGVYNKAAYMDERRCLMAWYADEVDKWRAAGRGLI
ncbi:tyrosine-type recombinase/integrase [Neisseria sp. WLZKY-1]|uniref:tyrosine-type recombinase/integrase n=1 Tax=Neisseria sp. WLZKY-1 TaxID=3390377 RepID=UPI00397C61BB